MSEKFLYEKFKNIDLDDEFFDSLKEDYTEFTEWFNRKADSDESAFIQLVNDTLDGFLYLKEESGPITDVTPTIETTRALKIGTFKVVPHNSRLGERFIKKSLDYAIDNNIKIVYVTVFSKHDYLMRMFMKYGFYIHGSKETENGTENVLVKDLTRISNDILLDYPLINSNSDAYLLSIKPEYHTQLFPDSKLYNESFDIIHDVSHTNSINKIYIAKMSGLEILKPNDNIVIYRTGDGNGAARFRAVATTICTLNEIYPMTHFTSYYSFKEFIKNYSIFDEATLHNCYYSNARFFVLKMTYNASLCKRLTRGTLLDVVGLNESQYWGFFKLSNVEFNHILTLGNVNPNYIK